MGSKPARMFDEPAKIRRWKSSRHVLCGPLVRHGAATVWRPVAPELRYLAIGGRLLVITKTEIATERVFALVDRSLTRILKLVENQNVF
jgi:hypothetical protein